MLFTDSEYEVVIFMGFWVIFNRKKNKIRFGSLYGHQNRCASEAVVLGLVSTGKITTDSKSHIKMVKLPFAKFYTYDI